ncbi:MAG TPA: VOC family protein [Hypericibacter adhaerens]|jgi:catechol 2,3-dioxygenase-like lactoylglutathione lyase family enzyme|nr:VOC family protein [Hypericibacter adhaerens]HWA41947.1 VOC family protein [Hypericibacter adhaerens]
MITGFNHTSFTVADIGKSVEFWTRHLGFKAASVSPRQGRWQEEVTGIAGASLMVAHLYGHGHHIEFIQYLAGAIPGAPPQPAQTAAAHVCLEVDDIQKTWAELMAAGASGQGRIADVSTGPVSGCFAGYLRDPNGIIIELLEMKPG